MTDDPDATLDDEPTLPDAEPLFDDALLTAGQLLGGRYTVEQLIGSGGGSVVWRAYDTSLHRTVAIKVLRPQLASDADAVRRFRGEAAIAARVSHPGVVAVYDVGTTDGHEWLALEHVAGTSLLDVLRAHPRGLEPEVAAAIVEQAATALGEAHRAGLVHRDVKPANLLVTPQGMVKVTDFGAAGHSLAGADGGDGRIVGTPSYVAPERFEGAGGTDPRLDVYSLGVVLHECLTGRPASTARRPSTRRPRAERELLGPRSIRPDVPRALDAIVVRAAHPDPAHRHEDGTALALALRPHVTVDPTVLAAQITRGVDVTSPGGPRPTGPQGRAPAATRDTNDRPSRWFSWRWALLVLAVLAVAGGMTQVLVRSDDRGATDPVAVADAGVPVLEVALFDPYGSVADVPDTLSAVVDDDPTTGWTTPDYPVPLRSLGTPGVGLRIDTGEPVMVDQVHLLLGTPGVTVELLVRDVAPGPGETEADWVSLGALTAPGRDARFDVGGAVGRHWLVWFTELEQTGDAWQASLLDVRFDPTEST